MGIFLYLRFRCILNVLPISPKIFSMSPAINIFPKYFPYFFGLCTSTELGRRYPAPPPLPAAVAMSSFHAQLRASFDYIFPLVSDEPLPPTSAPNRPAVDTGIFGGAGWFPLISLHEWGRGQRFAQENTDPSPREGGPSSGSFPYSGQKYFFFDP